MTDLQLKRNSEIINQLNESILYQQLIASNDPSANDLISVINNACNDAAQITKTILIHMKEYTLHDSEHLFRVLHIMGRLVPKKLIEETLSCIEIGILILSAFYHDVGMAPKQTEILLWKGQRLPANENEIQSKRKFDIYCAGNKELQRKIEYHTRNGNIAEADTLIDYRLSEWIRRTHAKRAQEIINEKRANFVYKGVNFSNYLIDVCLSHNDPCSKLLTYSTGEMLVSGEYVNIPYLGVILRLADILDFDGNRTPKVLFEHLGVKDPVSLKEWSKHRSIQAWDITPQVIRFRAECGHPVIEKAIKDFIEDIKIELGNCESLLKKMTYSPDRQVYKEQYVLSTSTTVILDVSAEKDGEGKDKYKYMDVLFQLNQTRIIELLMGTNLYGHPVYALRELLQNAVDTCRLRKVKAELWGDTGYSPRIRVHFYHDGDKDVIEIEDNGMGMDDYILKNYFSKVGSSYYRSTEFNEEMIDVQDKFTPISRFGIGFLSAFMIAEYVEIDTLRIKSSSDFGEKLNITIQGETGVFYVRNGTKERSGTLIKLFLKQDHPFGSVDATKEDSALYKYVKETLRHIEFPVKLETTSIEEEIGDSEYISDFGVVIPNTYPVRIYNFQLDNEITGIKGSVKCFFLIEGDSFLEQVILKESKIEYEGQEYPYTHSLIVKSGQIFESYESIQITKENIVSSYGFLTMGGITVGTDLFHVDPIISNDNEQNTRINWPFAIHYDIEVSDRLELNLTASRNSIIYDEHWFEFMEGLSYIIAKRLVEEIGNIKVVKSLVDILEKYDGASKLKENIIKIFKDLRSNEVEKYLRD